MAGKAFLKKGYMDNEIAFNCVGNPIFNLFFFNLCDVRHRQKCSAAQKTTHTRKALLFIGTVRRRHGTLVRYALFPPQNKALVFLGYRRFSDTCPTISFGLDSA